VCPAQVRQRQQAHLWAAFHPDVREASSRHRAPALRLGLVFPQPAGRQGVRAECRVPALLTAWVWQSELEASPGERPAQRASAWVLPPGLALPLAQAGPQEPRKAKVSAWGPAASVSPPAPAVALSERAAAEAEAAVVSARAAAEAAEVVASVHAAAVPRPEVASAAWGQQAAAGAAEEPDELRAAQPAGVAASGASGRQPAEAQRADAAVQLPAEAAVVPWAEPAAVQPAEAALPDAQQAAVPLALPSEAASVFRQGPILAGPAPSRAAVRSVHAMRSLRIASRSEPSWQAARNEGWSCGSTSPEGSLTKFGFNEAME